MGRSAPLALAALLVLAGACTGPPPWRTQLERAGIRFITAKELKAVL